MDSSNSCINCGLNINEIRESQSDFGNDGYEKNKKHHCLRSIVSFVDSKLENMERKIN